LTETGKDTARDGERGLSNKYLATEPGISRRTVEILISHILSTK